MAPVIQELRQTPSSVWDCIGATDPHFGKACCLRLGPEPRLQIRQKSKFA